MQEVVCISSVAQLEELSGVKGIKDLHRESIDSITIPSKQGKGTLKRIEEVFDCWFESGSMPYAQSHYPFANQEVFKKTFPADFVSEGIDQTRGWFYTLLVLGTQLFDTAPWKNLIVTGLVLAADGKKMSKKLKNYPDPIGTVEKYGADAVRLFLINSPVVRGDNLRFREEGVRDVLSNVILKWINSLNFYLNQVELFDQATGTKFMYDHDAPKSTNVFDRWILARCQSLIKLVDQEMSSYRLYTVIPRLLELIADLTNWYIRFNRRRLKGELGVEDTKGALNSLYEALYTLCLTMSSFTPFTCEMVYQSLRATTPAPKDGTDVRSVHFLLFPKVREEYFDPIIERQVQRLKAVIDLGRAVRDKRTLKVKMPLKELILFHHDQQYLDDVKSLESYVMAELNVAEIVYTKDEAAFGIKYKANADWPVLGRKLRKDLGKVKSHLPKMTSDECKSYMSSGKVTLNGVDLVEGDLVVTRFVELEGERAQTYESATDLDATILLDCRRHEDLEHVSLLRALTSRVNKLRKIAGLVPTDRVDVFYATDAGETDALASAIAPATDLLVAQISAVPTPAAQMSTGRKVLATEVREKEIGDDDRAERFILTLVERV
jgi:isoleucyl-tRNA synthetase